MTKATRKVSKNVSLCQFVESLCKTAKTGLGRFYTTADGVLPYSITIGPNGEWRLRGVSLRYAAMSQIGMAEWLKFHPEDATWLPDLWPKIVVNRDKIIHISDFALALWAGVASGADNCEVFARALSARWQSQAGLCNAVELAWIVQACALSLQGQSDLESIVWPMLDEAKNRLIAFFRPQQNLFQRHDRSGFREVVSRRIACFADQVYPIVALSTYGQYFNDLQSIEIAARTVDQICRFQGPLGQWWWHYDTARGIVCEEYPVFSVHQDGMAPMAIRASDQLSGHNHHREIELGLQWILGNNELNEDLLVNGAGIIWRDIQKREPPKLSRALRALLCVGGLRSLHSLAGRFFVGFRINHECRPYHLGWILYAWANYHLES